MYLVILNKQGFREASESQTYKGVWYLFLKTSQTWRFQIWFNTYSPLSFFCLSKAHGMYPFPHATQHLFFIQPVARFSSEQIS